MDSMANAAFLVINGIIHFLFPNSGLYFDASLVVLDKSTIHLSVDMLTACVQ